MDAGRDSQSGAQRAGVGEPYRFSLLAADSALDRTGRSALAVALPIGRWLSCPDVGLPARSPGHLWGLSRVDAHAIDPGVDHPGTVYLARCRHLLFRRTTLHNEVTQGRRCPTPGEAQVMGRVTSLAEMSRFRHISAEPELERTLCRTEVSRRVLAWFQGVDEPATIRVGIYFDRLIGVVCCVGSVRGAQTRPR